MQNRDLSSLLQRAQQRAELAFAALAQRALHEAEQTTLEQLRQTADVEQRSSRSAALSALRLEGPRLARRMEELYRSYLQRGLHTMYADFRQGLQELSADTLTLVDDEVMDRQIEVGRLAQLLRDADEEGIGRLNVMIASLHGEREVRERENPFRPYLLARAIHEGMSSIAPQATRDALEAQLVPALCAQLPGFFNELRNVFEQSGVEARFEVERSRGGYRHFQSWAANVAASAPGVPNLPNLPRLPAQTLHSAEVLAQLDGPLRRLQAMLPSLSGSAAAAAAAHSPLQDITQDIMRGSEQGNQQGSELESFLLRLLAARPSEKDDALPSASHMSDPLDPLKPLLGPLRQWQQAAADAQQNPGEPAGERKDSTEADSEIEPVAKLRAALPLDAAPVTARLTVELVSRLFEFIAGDARIAPAVRAQLVRLQAPLIEAALREPALLSDDTHPARRLLNRLGAAAATLADAPDKDSDGGGETAARLQAAIHSTVTQVLQAYDGDSSVFESALHAFTQVVLQVPGQQERLAPLVAAADRAEKTAILTAAVNRQLVALLLPLRLDQQMVDLSLRLWPRILVRAAREDAEQGGNRYRDARAALPALLWSVQDKSSAEERSQLVKLLPNLVKALRAALALADLTEEDIRDIMDSLVARHTSVLRAPPTVGSTNAASLAQLQRALAPLEVDWQRAAWSEAVPPALRPAMVESAFAELQPPPVCYLDPASPASVQVSEEEARYLAQNFLPGMPVRLRQTDGAASHAQLVSVTPYRALYLFLSQPGEQPTVFSAPALLDALDAGTVVPREPAPLFDRAIDAVLFPPERS